MPNHLTVRGCAELARLACRWALAVLLLPAGAWAQESPRACTRVPFQQQLPVETLLALVNTAPASLIARIVGLGIDVYRVPSASATKPANPTLAPLPEAPPSLRADAAFQDHYEAQAIPADAPCCLLPRPAVLIRDTATVHTLLHEVVHLLLRPADGSEPAADLELRFAVAFHRLATYQKRLYDDPWRLLDARWRRDILVAQREVAELLFDRIRIGQSQDAVAEHLLARCIDERSPYFDAARQAQGRTYGERMIDNAIDVFNEVQAAVSFNAETVTQLLADSLAGRLDAAPSGPLRPDDARAFTDASVEIQTILQRTRTALEELKRFYGAAAVAPGEPRPTRPAADVEGRALAP